MLSDGYRIGFDDGLEVRVKGVDDMQSGGLRRRNGQNVVYQDAGKFL